MFLALELLDDDSCAMGLLLCALWYWGSSPIGDALAASPLGQLVMAFV